MDGSGKINDPSFCFMLQWTKWHPYVYEGYYVRNNNNNYLDITSNYPQLTGTHIFDFSQRRTDSW